MNAKINKYKPTLEEEMEEFKEDRIPKFILRLQENG